MDRIMRTEHKFAPDLDRGDDPHQPQTWILKTVLAPGTKFFEAGVRMPGNSVHPTETVHAAVVRGHWQVHCPYCRRSNALVTPADPRFYCAACGNRPHGQWARVVFPPNIDEIEHELMRRPDWRDRNWQPDSGYGTIAGSKAT